MRSGYRRGRGQSCAIFIAVGILGLAGCAPDAGGGGSKEEFPTDAGFDCELPNGIAPGSPAAQIHCDLQSAPASPESRAALQALATTENLAKIFEGFDVPRLGDCTKRGDHDMMCVSAQTRFLEAWPDALAGDFVSMTDNIHCFETGCAGAVEPSPVDACAWAAVVVDSGSAYAGQGDAETRQRLCSGLDAEDADQATALAQRILKSR